jgi:hypothetical protein
MKVKRGTHQRNFRMLYVNVDRYDSRIAMIRSKVILCLLIVVNVTAILKEDQKKFIPGCKGIEDITRMLWPQAK